MKTDFVVQCLCLPWPENVLLEGRAIICRTTEPEIVNFVQNRGEREKEAINPDLKSQ